VRRFSFVFIFPIFKFFLTPNKGDMGEKGERGDKGVSPFYA